MSTQTISSKIIPKKRGSAFKGLTNWFNNSFSSYEIEPKDKTKFNLIDKKDDPTKLTRVNLAVQKLLSRGYYDWVYAALKYTRGKDSHLKEIEKDKTWLKQNKGFLDYIANGFKLS